MYVRGKAAVLGVVLGVTLFPSGGAEARPKPPESDPQQCRSLGEGQAGVATTTSRGFLHETHRYPVFCSFVAPRGHYDGSRHIDPSDLSEHEEQERLR